jgi:isopentenyl-diphosphate delta-isomerase
MNQMDFSAADLREQVIRVDEDDRAIGPAGKIDVHRSGELHRAFSVFLFDHSGRLLLQKRARGKYHSGGLWANSCCGHPRPGEAARAAAERRLREELGVDVSVRPAFFARYRAALGNGLIENEFVHMMFGHCAGTPRPNPDEASAVQWIELETLETQIANRPQDFSEWLRHYLRAHRGEIASQARRLCSGTCQPRATVGTGSGR